MHSSAPACFILCLNFFSLQRQELINRLRSHLFIKKNLLLDEQDLKVMQSKMYKALKADMMTDSRQKRVQLTRFGKKFVEKTIPITHTVPKLVIKEDNKNQEKVTSLESRIDTCLKNYEDDSQSLFGKRGKRRRKGNYEVYEKKTCLGFLPGHRVIFEDIRMSLNQYEGNLRPRNEEMFQKVLNTLQRVSKECI